MFRNEWVWEFFPKGFAYLVNFKKGLRNLKGVLNFVKYLDNVYKDIKITNLTSNRTLCNKMILFKKELKIYRGDL